MTLTPEERRRYSRNIALSSFGQAGQEKLRSAKVTVIGAGGLGSPALFYLVAAGVGSVHIIDADNIDTTNLQRQILYTENQIGQPKASAAASRLQQLNHSVSFSTSIKSINEQNCEQMLQGSSFVLEGSDNFKTKFLVNDCCVRTGIPFAIGAITGYEGQVLAVRPEKDGCFRCIFNDVPARETSCEFEGVIGSAAGVIGSLQATLAIQYLSGNESGFGYLHTLDMATWNFRKIKSPQPACATHDLPFYRQT